VEIEAGDDEATLHERIKIVERNLIVKTLGETGRQIMSERKAIRRALVSVYDKSRLVEIGNALQAAGVEILSTGSTCKTLLDNGINSH